MPIYEYECPSCQHYFEALQKISDTPISVCPKCGGVEVRKLVSAAAFELKGNGWYVTDFKNSKKAEKTETAAENSGCGGGCSCCSNSTATSSETKTASSSATTATE